MRLSFIIAALLILLTGAATAGTVILENGDQVTGDILSSQGRTLIVKTEHMGIVRIPVSAVSEIKTDGAFTVQLASGDRISGLLKTDGDGNLTIRSASGAVSTPIDDVHGMMPVPMDLAFPDGVDAAVEQVVQAGWSGDVELGVNYQTGNTERMGIAFRFSVVRDAPNDKFEVNGGLLYTEEDDTRNTNRQFLTIQENLKFGSWYVFGLLAFNRDEFKDIDLRGALTPGVGYIFADSDDWKLLAEVGPTMTYTDWRDGESEWTFEIFFAAKAEVTVFESAKLYENLFLYPSITNSPDFRLISETGFEQPLSESLFLRIAFIVNYDTSVSSPTRETDTKLLITLAMKF